MSRTSTRRRSPSVRPPSFYQYRVLAGWWWSSTVWSGRVLRCSQARSESSADGRDCESAQVRDPFYTVACRLPSHPADDFPDRTCPIYDEFGLGLSFAIERLSGQCVYGDQATFSWFFGAASLACWFQGEFEIMAPPPGRKRTPDD